MNNDSLFAWMKPLLLAPFLALASGCDAASELQNFQRQPDQVREMGGSHSSANIYERKTPDPALKMQQRVAYFPSPWPELSHLDQGGENFKKLAGTLARVQWLAARKSEVRGQLPVVLINATSDCIDTLTVGLYRPSCQTIKLDYTDGQMYFEYPVEVEAVLAHEWGHHLAEVSNLNVSSTEHEIVADCFAGVIFGYYVKHDLISVEEGVNALVMMAQVSNNSESGIHPNMQNRTSAFMGGMARIADPQGEFGDLYGKTCGSLDQVIDVTKVQSMGLTWPG